MNKKDIKEYVIDSRETTLYYELPQSYEIVQELFKKFGIDNNAKDWKEIEEHLKKVAPHQKYFLNSIQSSGTTRTKYIVKDRYYKGEWLKVEYKNVEFYIDCLKDGTVYNLSHTFNIYQKDSLFNSSHHKLKKCENIEEYYQEYLKDVKLSKRKYMTFYNKEIRKIKQNYKEVLKYHNKRLKEESQ